MGWAASLDPPADRSDPNANILYHNNGFGQYGVIIAEGTYAEYDSWIEKFAGGLPTETATSTPGPTETATETPTDVPTTTSVPAPTGTPVPAGKEYDYIVVGGGAGGLVGKL